MYPLIENYTILRELGAGGMAKVYEATDNRSKRTVALKMLHPHLCNDSIAKERFKREALNAARMDHPNIVRIFDYITDSKSHIIVMENIPGYNLDSILMRRSKLTLGSAIEIMNHIACALGQAHGFGIMHLDIKPANILIHKQGRVMLSDFGLAHHVFDSHLTNENIVAGTPSFMSPEQLCGNEPTTASDIYSWAVTFYRLTTGKLPYASQQLPDILPDIKQGKIVLEKNNFSEDCHCYLELLQRCLNCDPLKRIKDGNELKEQMASCRKKSPLNAEIDLLLNDTETKTSKKARIKKTAVDISKWVISKKRSIF